MSECIQLCSVLVAKSSFFLFVFFIALRNQRASDGVVLAVMERNLFRLKAATMPKSPKTAAEIELEFQNENRMDEWGYSQVI